MVPSHRLLPISCSTIYQAYTQPFMRCLKTHGHVGLEHTLVYPMFMGLR
jgi:hypothetical protein